MDTRKFRITCPFSNTQFCPLTEEGAFHATSCPLEADCLDGKIVSEEEMDRYLVIHDWLEAIEVTSEIKKTEV